MEPINGLTALYEILRRKISDSGAAKKKATATDRSDQAPLQQVSMVALEQQLRTKLKGLPVAAVTSPSARRMVISCLLAWELDDRLQNEPKFNALVLKVQKSIDDNAQLKARFDQVTQELSK
jgi:hypothetical protein